MEKIIHHQRNDGLLTWSNDYEICIWLHGINTHNTYILHATYIYGMHNGLMKMNVCCCVCVCSRDTVAHTCTLAHVWIGLLHKIGKQIKIERGTCLFFNFTFVVFSFSFILQISTTIQMQKLFGSDNFLNCHSMSMVAVIVSICVIVIRM